MAKLIIHIGTFKTGTTALQKYLARQRETLLQEQGLLFPRSGEIPAGGHHNLVYEVTGSWKYVASRGGFADLEREINESSFRSVLISAENLSSYAVSNQEVSRRFGDFAKALALPVTVVCYVRPQWEYMDSYYSQGVKSGYTTCSFDQFVENAFHEDIYDYEKVIKPWENIAAEIVVRPYPGRNLVPEMCHWLGIPELVEGSVSGVERRNVRFGAKRLEFMRRMGAALEETRAPFRTRIPLAHRLRDTIMALDLDDVRFSGLDNNIVEKIHARYDPGNLRLSERFKMKPEWCALPSHDFKPATFSMGDATESDLQIFNYVMASVLVGTQRQVDNDRL